VLAVMPASERQIHVEEFEAQLGLGWDTAWSRRWTLQIGPRLGGRAHRFMGDQARLLERSGTRFDVLATLAATAQWRPWIHLGVGIELVAGVTSKAYRHDIDGLPVWSRGAARVQAGVRLEWLP